MTDSNSISIVDESDCWVTRLRENIDPNRNKRHSPPPTSKDVSPALKQSRHCRSRSSSFHLRIDLSDDLHMSGDDESSISNSGSGSTPEKPIESSSNILAPLSLTLPSESEEEDSAIENIIWPRYHPEDFDVENFPPIIPDHLSQEGLEPGSISQDLTMCLPAEPEPQPPGFPLAAGRKHRTSTRMRQRGDYKAVAKALCSRCCSTRCMSNFTPSSILQARQIFLQMAHRPASEWICKMMKSFCNPNSPKWSFQILGKGVCQNAFLLFHGISSSKWYSVRKSFLRGRTHFIHRRSGTMALSPKSILVKQWMNEFILGVGDTPTNSEIHLPMAIRKVDLHARMLRELRISHPHLQEGDFPGELLFRKVWKKDFPHVKVPKRTRLGKCDHCCLLNKKREGPLNRLELMQVKRQYFEHIQSVRDERTLYYQRQSKAIIRPYRYTSLILDYAQKMFLPHNHR